MITINGLSLPAPSSLSVRVTPQAGTAQYNTLGEMVQDGMRDKRTVEITWVRMDAELLRQLAQTLSAGGFFPVLYPDPLSGRRSMNARVTDHSARVYRWQDQAPVWADVKMTLEER